jgi:nicotinamide mononucleotide transporter
MIEQIIQTKLIEWIAFAFALLQVLLAAKNKAANFIAGFISTILYTYILYFSGLFAEASLNVYYAFISLWGLHIWLGKKQEASLPISRTSVQEKYTLTCVILASFLLLVYVLKKYTTSTVPVWDSLAASLAWGGAWLMAKKKIENWWVLNASNFLSVGLFYYKGLLLTSFLSILLFVIAIFGWHQWRKILRGA